MKKGRYITLDNSDQLFRYDIPLYASSSKIQVFLISAQNKERLLTVFPV